MLVVFVVGEGEHVGVISERVNEGRRRGVRNNEGKGKVVDTGVRTDGVLGGVGGESAGWRRDVF